MFSPFVLENLTSDSMYEVFVTAVNVHGAGEPSQRIVFSTQSKVPNSLPWYTYIYLDMISLQLFVWSLIFILSRILLLSSTDYKLFPTKQNVEENMLLLLFICNCNCKHWHCDFVEKPFFSQYQILLGLCFGTLEQHFIRVTLIFKRCSTDTNLL